MINCKSKFYTETEIAIMRVANDGDALKRLKDYRNNKEVVKAAINHLPNAFSYASDELRDDEEIFLSAMLHSDIRAGYGADIFKSASERLRSDEEVVWQVVEKDAWCLEFASEKLRANKEIVLKALGGYCAKRDMIYSTNPGVLQFASDELKADKEVAREGWLEFVAEDLRADKDFVIEAVKKYGSTLEFAADKLKDDKDVVTAAVQARVGGDEALKFASVRLKKDKDIALVAVNNDYNAYEYLDETLKHNKEIILATLKQFGWMLCKVPKDFQNDKDIVLVAVENYPAALEYASKKLKANKDVVLAAVLGNVDALEFASDELKSDQALKYLKRGYWGDE